MTHSGLDEFGAYRKSLELFDLVVEDMVLLQKDTLCYRLISEFDQTIAIGHRRPNANRQGARHRVW